MPGIFSDVLPARHGHGSRCDWVRNAQPCRFTEKCQAKFKGKEALKSRGKTPSGELEASPGIEPGCKDLQSSA
jgi:hypothetical protein